MPDGSVTHVSEQLLPISPVYTPIKGEDLVFPPLGGGILREGVGIDFFLLNGTTLR